MNNFYFIQISFINAPRVFLSIGIFSLSLLILLKLGYAITMDINDIYSEIQNRLNTRVALVIGTGASIAVHTKISMYR